MGGIRSQLVRKFESTPEQDVAEADNVVEAPENNVKGKDQKECSGQEKTIENSAVDKIQATSERAQDNDMEGEEEQPEESTSISATVQGDVNDESMPDAESEPGEDVSDTKATPESVANSDENGDGPLEKQETPESEQIKESSSGGGLKPFLNSGQHQSTKEASSDKTKDLESTEETGTHASRIDKMTDTESMEFTSKAPAVANEKNMEMDDASPAKGAAKAAKASAAEEDKQSQLSPECQALYDKHEALRSKYCMEADKLVRQGREGFEDEDFSIDMPSTEGTSGVAADMEFPDAAVPHLSSLVEGRCVFLCVQRSMPSFQYFFFHA
jgi:hypothetical protein